jgi:tetratricopeptide (TPR) repeat protein
MKQLTIILGILILTSNVVVAEQNECETPDGLPPVAVYSLFYSNYRNGDYEFALKYGRWMVECEVREIEGNNRYSLARHYERMIKTYEEIAKAKQDPAVKAAYIDTALTLFDNGFEIFSEDDVDSFEWKLDKGRFIQTNADFVEGGASEAFDIYRELFNEDPERTTELGEGYYFQIILQDMVSKGEKQEALEAIDKATPYMNEKTVQFAEKVKFDLFESPEELIAYWEAELEKDPENLDVLRELRELYEDQDMRQKAIQIARKLYELNPTFENAKTLGQVEKNNASYSEAAKYYGEAYEKASTDEEKESMALELAGVNLSRENLQEARRWARRTLQHNPNSGQAYIQIANIYGQSVSQCTRERKLDRMDRVVYWLVLDYLDKAKNADSSVANQVNRLYQTYEPVTPTQEDKFFVGWNAGDKIDVDSSLNACYDWIDETTTVR